MIWVEGDPKNSLTGLQGEDELKLLLQVHLSKVWCWHMGNLIMHLCYRCDSVN